VKSEKKFLKVCSVSAWISVSGPRFENLSLGFGTRVFDGAFGGY
jgi:hypothetical protein